jgi:hypothetical protein
MTHQRPGGSSGLGSRLHVGVILDFAQQMLKSNEAGVDCDFL